MEDKTEYFSKAALWDEDWIEDSTCYGIAGYGMTVVENGDYVEKEWYYELLEEYKLLLSKLNSITEGE